MRGSHEEAERSDRGQMRGAERDQSNCTEDAEGNLYPLERKLTLVTVGSAGILVLHGILPLWVFMQEAQGSQDKAEPGCTSATSSEHCSCPGWIRTRQTAW